MRTFFASEHHSSPTHADTGSNHSVNHSDRTDPSAGPIFETPALADLEYLQGGPAVQHAGRREADGRARPLARSLAPASVSRIERGSRWLEGRVMSSQSNFRTCLNSNMFLTVIVVKREPSSASGISVKSLIRISHSLMRSVPLSLNSFFPFSNPCNGLSCRIFPKSVLPS